MRFAQAFVASTLALLAAAQTPTTLSGAQESKVIKDLASYLSSLAEQPEYTSNAMVLATAIPESVIEGDPTDFISQFATSTPAWFTDLPSNVQSYYSSIGAAEQSIYNKDVKGPAPTVGPKAKVAALVGAGVGAVAMAL